MRNAQTGTLEDLAFAANAIPAKELGAATFWAGIKLRAFVKKITNAGSQGRKQRLDGAANFHREDVSRLFSQSKRQEHSFNGQVN